MTADQCGNANGHTCDVIELALTEEVQREQIVATGCFLYNFGSKSVNLKLNHKYENKWIDSPIDIKDWEQTSQELHDILERNGVPIEDRIKIVNMLNHNYEIIS